MKQLLFNLQKKKNLMKVYIIILIITLVSCSNFPFKQKRMRDINLKGSFSILQDIVNEGINGFFKSIEEFFDILIYLSDNSKSSKIINTINEYFKIAENFLIDHSFNDLIKLEKKIKEEVEGIRLNPENIELYMKHSNFPSEIILLVNSFVAGIVKNDKKLIDLQVFFSSVEKGKNYFIDRQIREKILKSVNEAIKKIGKDIEIENISQYKEKIINDIEKNLNELDKMMPQIIYTLKLVYQKLKSIFNSKKKFDDFRKHFRTFFKIKQSTSIEDYELLLKSYDVLLNNFLNKLFEELKFQKSFDFDKYILNDLNILVHENHKGEAYAGEILKIAEKIFIYYNVKNFISDFRNAVNALNNIVKKIKKNGLNLEKWLPQLKENFMNWKEENMKNIVNGILDHFKLIVTS